MNKTMEELKQHIDECEGIQTMYEAFYSEAIQFNLVSAITSIELLVETLQKRNELKHPGELNNLVLNSIQNILLHSANVSKYFWPINKGINKIHKKRAQKLRRIFDVSDCSPLRNKELRNHLEHLDENLDKYLWSKPIVGKVFPAYVGQEMARDEVPYHFFRAVFESLGVRLELQPIVNELYEVYEKSTNQDS